MIAGRDQRILNALVSARAFLRAGAGNPYHDSEGKFTSAGGSGGAHHPSRRRRRLKRALRRLKARHRADRRALAEKQRAAHESHRQYYARKEGSMARRHSAERARLERRHDREIAAKEARRARERTREGKASPEQVAAWEAYHAEDVRTDREMNARIRESQRLDHEGERNSLREERREEAARMRGRHAGQRRRMLADQRAERAEAIEAHGFRRKGAGDAGLVHGRGGPIAMGMRPVGRAPGVPRRFAAGRTHKAGSAESIFRHVLRTLGWTAAYRRGELTERQRLTLLDAVREYGRTWLRHEAESLFRHYGSERSLTNAMRHHVGRFFSRVKQFTRELILAGSLALNGPEPPDEHDLREIDRQAQVQAAYLDRFRSDVELRTPPEIAVPGAPPDPEAMTVPQFVARTEQYAGCVWGDAINARREKIRRAGVMRWERRMHAKPLGQHDACATCEGESAKGWVPIGTLLPIGDSECLGIHCDCYYEFSEARPAA